MNEYFPEFRETCESNKGQVALFPPRGVVRTKTFMLINSLPDEVEGQA